MIFINEEEKQKNKQDFLQPGNPKVLLSTAVSWQPFPSACDTTTDLLNISQCYIDH